MAEHPAFNRKVVGSLPTAPTRFARLVGRLESLLPTLPARPLAKSGLTPVLYSVDGSSNLSLGTSSYMRRLTVRLGIPNPDESVRLTHGVPDCKSCTSVFK